METIQKIITRAAAAFWAYKAQISVVATIVALRGPITKLVTQAPEPAPVETTQTITPNETSDRAPAAEQATEVALKGRKIAPVQQVPFTVLPEAKKEIPVGKKKKKSTSSEDDGEELVGNAPLTGFKGPLALPTRGNGGSSSSIRPFQFFGNSAFVPKKPDEGTNDGAAGTVSSGATTKPATVTPTIAITEPASDSYINIAKNKSTFKVLGTCSISGKVITINVDGEAATGQSGGLCDGSNFTATIDVRELGDGAHKLSASMVTSSATAATKTSITSADVSVTKDTVAPDAPTAIVLSVPATSISTNASPIFKVTLASEETGETVSIFTDSGACLLPGLKGYATVTSTNVNVPLTTPLTTDGKLEYYAQVTDAAGNPSDCSSVHAPYTMDHHVPTLAITSPAANTYINSATNSATFPISGTCSEAGQAITVMADGGTAVPSNITCTGPGFTGTIDTTGLSEGAHSFTASSVSVSGISGTSPAISPVTKDTVAPAAPIAVTLTTVSPGFTTTPAFTVTVASYSASESAGVELYYGVAGACTTKVASGTPSGATTALTMGVPYAPLPADDTYVFNAITADAAGNHSSCSTVNTNYVLDRHVPTIALTTDPVDNSYINIATDSAPGTLNVVGTCSVADVGRPIQVLVDGSPVATTPAVPTCQAGGVVTGITIASAVIPAGITTWHTVDATITTSSGFSASTSGVTTKHVKRDLVAPAAATALSWTEASPYNGTTVHASWTVSAASDLFHQSIQLYTGASCSVASGGAVAINDNTTNTYAFAGLVSGTTYGYKITSIDNAGNPTVSSCSSDMVVDTHTPTITLVNPVNNSYINSSTIGDTSYPHDSPTFAFSGLCSEASRTVSLYIDGSTTASATATCDGTNYAGTFSTTGLTQAAHTFVTKITATNLVTVASAPANTATRDVTAPLDATTLGWAEGSPYNGTTVTAAWTVSASSDIFHQSIQLYTGASCATASGAAIAINDNTTISHSFAGLTTGTTYGFKITSIDNAGNSSTSSCSPDMVIDTHTPTITLVTPVNSSYINSSTVGDSSFPHDSTTFAFNGTCSEASRTVSLYIDGSGTASATATCDGTNYAGTVSTTGLTEAAHTFVAKITATNLVTVASAPANSATRDVTAPALSTSLGWTETTPYNGTSVHANWTVSGSSDLFHQSIQLYTSASCATASGSAIAINDATTATYNFTGLTTGTTYGFKVTSIDNAGNYSTTACSSDMVIDTHVPTITLVDPVNNSYINSSTIGDSSYPHDSAAFTFTGTCSEAGRTVSLYIDGSGTAAATATCDGTNFSDTVSTTGLTEAAHTFVAKITATNLVTVASAPANTATRDVTAPANATSLGWTEASPYNGTSVHAAWTVSAATDLFHQKIQLYTGASCGATSGAAIAINDATTNTYNFTGLTTGTTYGYKITSIDNAGNVITSGCSSDMVIDTHTPTIALVNPVDASYINSSTVGDNSFPHDSTTFAFSGTCSEAGRTVSLYIDGSGAAAATANCDGTNFSGTVSTTGLTEANHTFVAKITATNLVTVSSSPTTNAVRDVTAPTNATTLGWTEVSPFNGNTLHATWTVSAASDLFHQSIQLYTGASCATASGSAIAINDNTTATYTFNGLASGTFGYKITSIDNAGNVATSGCSADAIIDTHNPAITLVTPADTSYINSATVGDSSYPHDSSTFAFNGTCSESGRTVSLYVDANSTPVGTATCDGVNFAGTNLDTTGLSAGAHTFYAKITATNGITATSTPVNHVTRDVTAPANATTLGWTEVSPYNGTTVHASWTVSAASDLFHQSIQLYTGASCGATSGAAIAINDNSTDTYTFTGLTTGTTYGYKITSIDNAGNVATSGCSSDMVIDTHTPTITLVTPVNNSYINSSTVGDSSYPHDSTTFTFDGTCSEASRTVSLYIDGSGTAAATANCDGTNFSGTFSTTGLTQAAHTFVAKITATNLVTVASAPANTATRDVTAPANATSLGWTEGTPFNGTTVHADWTLSAASDLFHQSIQLYTGASCGATSGAAIAINDATTHAYTFSGLTTGTTYGYKITSIDNAGNVATSGCSSDMVIDTHTPTITLVVPVNSSYINSPTTGDSSFPHDSATFAFNGTCSEVSQTVSLYIDGSGTASATATCDGTNYAGTVSTTGLTEAAHTFVAKITATNLVTVASAPANSATRDVTTPADATSLGWTEATPYNGTTVHAAWTKSAATDLYHQAIQLYTGASCATASGSLIAINDATTQTYAFTGLTTGTTYGYKLTSIDNAGNTTTSACSSDMVIDTHTPTITLVAPVDASYINSATIGDSSYPHDSATFSFNGTCSEASRTVSLYVDANSTPVGTATCDGANFAGTNLDTTALSAGAHTFYAKITATNLVTATSSPVNTSTRDVTGPADATTLGWTESTPYNGTTVHAAWTVSAATDLFHQKIQLYTGASCSATSGTAVAINDATTHAYTFSGLTTGTTYGYKITSIDNAGNTTTSPCSSDMVIDTHVPTIAITTAPVDNSYINIASDASPGTVSIVGTCSVADVGQPIKIQVDGSDVTTSPASPTCQAGGVFPALTIATSTVPSGITTWHTIDASITSAAGVSADTTTAPTTKHVKRDLVAPASATSLAWSVSSPTNGHTFNGTWTHSSAGDFDHQTVQFFASSGCATGGGSVTTVATSDDFAAFPFTADGTYSFKVVTYDLAGNPDTTSPCSADMVIDTSAPTITNVTATNADGTYTVGSTIHVTVQFSKVVNVTGTPQLTLNTSPSPTVVDYTSGTGTNTLTFDYAIASGDSDADLNYSATNALAFNSGTIQDAAGNTATLTLPGLAAAGSLGTNKNIVIDAIAPTITNVTATNADGSYGAGSNIDITVQFSEVVNVVTAGGTPYITLNPSPTTRTAAYLSGTGTNTLTFRYTVVAGDTSADLAYPTTSSLNINSGTIKDAATNDANVTLPTDVSTHSLAVNKNIVIDTTAPYVTDVTSTLADGSYTTGQDIDITVSFSEIVNVVTTGGTPTLTLNVTPSTRTASYLSGSGSTDLVFRYTVLPTDQSADLDYGSTTALAFNSGTIKDAALNVADLTLVTPGTTHSLGDNKNIEIRATPQVFIASTGPNAITHTPAPPAATTALTAINTLSNLNAYPVVGTCSEIGTSNVTITATDSASTAITKTIDCSSSGGGTFSDTLDIHTLLDGIITFTAAQTNGAGTTTDTAYGFKDITAPTITSVTTSGPNPTVGTTIPFTVSFSENVGLVLGTRFHATTGTVGTVTCTGATCSFDVTLSPAPTVVTDIAINLDANAVTDAYGNPNAAYTGSTYVHFYPAPNSFTGTVAMVGTSLPNIVVGLSSGENLNDGTSAGSPHSLTAKIYKGDSTCDGAGSPAGSTDTGSATPATAPVAVTANTITVTDTSALTLNTPTLFYARFFDGTNYSACSSTGVSVTYTSPTVQFTDSTGLSPRSGYTVLSSTGASVGSPIYIGQYIGNSLSPNNGTNATNVRLTVTPVTALKGTQYTPKTTSTAASGGLAAATAFTACGALNATNSVSSMGAAPASNAGCFVYSATAAQNSWYADITIPASGTPIAQLDNILFGIVNTATVSADTYFIITLSNPTNAASLINLGSNVTAQVNIVDSNYVPTTVATSPVSTNGNKYGGGGDVMLSESLYTVDGTAASPVAKIVLQRPVGTSVAEMVDVVLDDGATATTAPLDSNVSGATFNSGSGDFLISAPTITSGGTTSTDIFWGGSGINYFTVIFNATETEKTISIPIAAGGTKNKAFYARVVPHTFTATLTGGATGGPTMTIGVPQTAGMPTSGSPRIAVYGPGVTYGTTFTLSGTTGTFYTGSAGPAVNTRANGLSTLSNVTLSAGTVRAQSVAKIRIINTASTDLLASGAGVAQDACDPSVTTKFGGGYGVAAHPYLVCNTSQWALMYNGTICNANVANLGGGAAASGTCNAAGMYFKLASDFSMAAIPTNPTTTFFPNLDGNEYNIYGYNSSTAVPLFGGNLSTSNASFNTNAYIKNLNVLHASLYGAGLNTHIGVLNGYLPNTVKGGYSFQDDFVSGNVVQVSGANAGMLVGTLSPYSSNQGQRDYFDHCMSVGSVSASGQTGGLVGAVIQYGASDTAIEFNYSYSTAKVSSAANYNGGGIVGNLSYNAGVTTFSSIKVDHNTVTGFINSPSGGNSGGIVGAYAANSTNTQTFTITNNTFSGSIVGTTGLSYSTGGILGAFSYAANTSKNSTLNFDNNTNSGSIYGASNVGGLIGNLSMAGLESGTATPETIIVTNSTSTGNVAATTTYVGGAIGYAYLGTNAGTATNSITITGNTATGMVSGATAAGANRIGGFAGILLMGSTTTLSSFTFSNNHAEGDVYCNVGFSCGGFVGDLGPANAANGAYTFLSSWANGNVYQGSSTSLTLGGFAGIVSGSETLESDYATGNVNGLAATTISDVGGFAGKVAGTTTKIINSYANGNITTYGSAGADSKIGGFVGNASFAATTTQYYYGDYATGGIVSKGQYIGGFIGQAYTNTNVNLYVSHSYATGNITVTGGSATTKYIGGFIGYLAGANPSAAYIDHSYASGSISDGASGSSNLAGGFVGGLYPILNTTIDINTSYASGSVALQGGTLGGFVGVIDYGNTVGTGASVRIHQSYATGNVTTATSAVACTTACTAPSAGFLGVYANVASGFTGSTVIASCYSIGTVTGGGASMKGFWGGENATNSFAPTIANSFYLADPTGGGTIAGPTIVTGAQLAGTDATYNTATSIFKVGNNSYTSWDSSGRTGEDFTGNVFWVAPASAGSGSGTTTTTSCASFGCVATAQFGAAANYPYPTVKNANFAFTINDATTPTISSVTSVMNNSTYAIGTTIDIVVNYSEIVYVNGSPTFAINIGGVTRYATYFSGSGSSSLIFRYTVVAGDATADLTYDALAASITPATTITDSWGNQASVATNAGTVNNLAGQNIVIVNNTLAVQFTDSSGTPRNHFTVIDNPCTGAPLTGCANSATVGTPVGSATYLSLIYSDGSAAPASSSDTVVTITPTLVTALSATNFNSTPGAFTVTIPAGSLTSAAIDTSNFNIKAGASVFADAYFTLGITSATNGAVVGPTNIAQMNIVDHTYIPPTYNGGDLMFSHSFYSSSSGVVGANTVALTVQRPLNTTGIEKIQVNFIDGAATAGTGAGQYDPTSASSGSDYDATSHILTFNANETEKTLTVPVKGTTDGLNQSFYVQLTNQKMFTGTVASGSDIITGISASDMPLLVNGESIVGYGIPDGATITNASYSSTSIQISSAATATLSAGQVLASLNGSTRSQSIAKVRIMGTNTTGGSDSTCNAALTTHFGGGLGTAAKPYLICNMTQFANMSGSHCDAAQSTPAGSTSACTSNPTGGGGYYFRMMADMTWSGSTQAMGNSFDGNQYVIYNYTSASAAALFSNTNTNTGTVQTAQKNLNMLYASVSGGTVPAIFVKGNGNSSGYASTLTDIFVSGYVNCGANGTCGMVAAYIEPGLTAPTNSTTTRCMSTGRMDGTATNVSYFGGIAGQFVFGGATTTPNVDFSYNFSTTNMLVAGKYVGGMVGSVGSNINGTSAVNVTRSINTGYIKGSDYVGGIVGYFMNHKTTNGALTHLIQYNQNSGTISATGANYTGTAMSNGAVGGIIGAAIPYTTMTGTGTFYSIDYNLNSGNISGKIYIGGLVGQLGAAVAIGSVDGYKGSVTNSINTGTISDSINAVAGMGGAVGSVMCAGAGTNCTGITFTLDRLVNTGAVKYSYTTAGSTMGGILGYYTDSSVTGIQNVSFNLTNSQNSGTVGTTNGFAVATTGGAVGTIVFGKGAVTPVGVNATISGNIVTSQAATSSASPTGASYIGGFVGYVNTYYTNNFIFANNKTDAAVNCGGNYYCGGFAGYFASSVTTSTASMGGNGATGNVTSTGASTYGIGGFVGYLLYTSIYNSYSTGNVTISGTGTLYVGGFIGRLGTGNATTNTIVSRCYATGNVSDTGNTTNSYMGGFVGSVTGNANINRSWSTGNVTTAGSYAGGFVGIVDGGNFTQCYSAGQTVTATNYLAGFAGYLTNNTTNITSFVNNYTTTAVSSAGAAKYGFSGWMNGNPKPYFVQNFWLANGSITDYTSSGGQPSANIKVDAASLANTVTSGAFTGTSTNGSKAITGIPSTAGLAVGMLVTGTNIPVASVITEITSSTEITISNNATGANTGLYATDIYSYKMVTIIPTASSGTSISGIASTSQLYAGMSLTGQYVVANTTISTIASSTSITVNNSTSGNMGGAYYITAVGTSDEINWEKKLSLNVNWMAPTASGSCSYAGCSVTNQFGVAANYIYPTLIWDNPYTVNDTTPPSFASLTGATSDGSFMIGNTLYIVMRFNEDVTMSSDMTLALSDGRTATYVSGSGGKSILFAYTVQAGDNSSDLDLTSSTFATGTLYDVNGNAASLATINASIPLGAGSSGSLANASNYVIDTTAPTVTAVSTTTGAGTYTTIGYTIDIAVQFSESVVLNTSGGTPTLKTNTTPNYTLATYTSTSTTTYPNDTLNFTYTIASADASAHLTYFDPSSLLLNGATLTDVVGNGATTTLPANTTPSLYTAQTIIIQAGTVVVQLTDAAGNTRTGFSLLDSLCTGSPTGCATATNYGVPVGSPIYVTVGMADGSALAPGAFSGTTVTLASASVTAVTGTDFTASSSISVIIPSGSTSAVVDSSSFGATGLKHPGTTYADNFFTLSISSATNSVSVGNNAQAQVNIVDPSYVTPTYGGGGDVMFSSSFYTATNPSGTVNAALYLQRAFNTSAPETVDVVLENGTATAGTDYFNNAGATPTPIPVTFPAGTVLSNQEQTLTIPTYHASANVSFFARIVPHAFTGTLNKTNILTVTGGGDVTILDGQVITGPGIPTGTTILSHTGSGAGATLTLSAQATISTVAAVTFSTGNARTQSVAKVRIMNTSASPSPDIVISGTAAGTTTCNPNATTPFGGGVDGTSPGSPYLICSSAQFYQMTNSASCNDAAHTPGGVAAGGSACNAVGIYFKLMGDFSSASNFTWTTPALPGTSATGLLAHLDGNEYAISNYTYSGTYSSLFGAPNSTTSGMYVKNLNVLWASVTATTSNAGILLGLESQVGTSASTYYRPKLTNVYVNGYLFSSTANTGNFGMISGSIAGNSAGTNFNSQYLMTSGTIKITGAIPSAGAALGGVGGFYGMITPNTTTNTYGFASATDILNSYSSVNIFTSKWITVNAVNSTYGTGGFVGWWGAYNTTSYQSNLILDHLVSTGHIATGVEAGGILGASQNFAASANTTVSALTISNSTFSGSIVSGVSGCASGGGYAGGIVGDLIVGVTSANPGAYTQYFIDSNTNLGSIGTTCGNAAYMGGIIGTVRQLTAATAAAGQQVTINNNVNYGTVNASLSANNLVAIGGIVGLFDLEQTSTTATGLKFTKNINNGNIIGGGGNNGGTGGVFGSFVSRDFTAGAFESGGAGTGGFTMGGSSANANSNNGTIKTASGTAQSLGGFAGKLSSTASAYARTIDHNYSTGSVIHGVNGGGTGGFVGNVVHHSLSYDFATGDITGTGATTYLSGQGGFVGQINASSSTIDHCFATGSLTDGSGFASNSMGGFVGAVIINGYATTINSSWSTGSIYQGTAGTSNSGTGIGGFIGYAHANSAHNLTISQSYTTSAITANGTANGGGATIYAAGGFVGNLNAQVTGATLTFTSCYTTSTLTTPYGGSAGFYAGHIVGSGYTLVTSYTNGPSYYLNAGTVAQNQTAILRGAGQITTGQLGTYNATGSTGTNGTISGTTTVTLSSGSIAYFAVGQPISATAGTGSMAASATISTIGVNNSTFTMSPVGVNGTVTDIITDIFNTAGWENQFTGGTWNAGATWNGPGLCDGSKLTPEQGGTNGCPSASYPYPTIKYSW